jgi:hypothetical protein
MQRHKLNLQSGFYNEADVYKPVPVYRQQVVPGQTVNIDAQVSIKSAALTKNVTTPALCSVWFFYVPHRLAWSGWMDFISKDENAPAFPETATDWTYMFDNTTASPSNMSPLYRRAFKLVYNEYFGTEQISDAWYSNIATDTDTSVKRLRNPEQFASKIQLQGTVDDPEFTVSGSAIPLNDFYRQMMNARSQQRSQMTGNKYVDTLARMGVDATWMITERPEFLGTKSKLISPALTANTSATSTGQETGRFNCTLDVKIASKHFAEHGYIIGIAGMRPMVMFDDRSAQDPISGTAAGWIDTFYSADNLQTKDSIVDSNNGFSATAPDDKAYTQRFSYLRNGAWIYGNADRWAISNALTSWENLIYPTAGLPIGDELGTNQIACTSSVSLKGLTPVPISVA